MTDRHRIHAAIVVAVKYGGIDGAHLGTRGLLHDTATN